MGVYILDMEMPKSCGACRFNNVIDDFRCMALPKDDDEAYFDIAVEDGVRDEKCPLVEIPEDARWQEGSFTARNTT